MFLPPRMAHLERSHKLMDGIVMGIPKRSHRPVVEGIVSGVPRAAHLKATPDLHKVTPSATQNSEGVFGAGRTPQGDGNGKTGGMKKASDALPKRRMRAAKLEEHIEQHNY